jgi:hypothetical protein
MQHIKEEDIRDDGRWFDHEDLGRIRSGPRGNRFWETHWLAYNQDVLRDSVFNDTVGDLTQLLIEDPNTVRLHSRSSESQNTHYQLIDKGAGAILHTQSPYSDPRRAHQHRDPIKQEENHTDSSIFVEDRTLTRSPTTNDSSSHADSTDIGRSQEPPNHQPQPATPPASPDPEQIQFQQLPPLDCDCPIDLECHVRSGHLIDCRRLVPVVDVMRAWQANQQQYDPME